MCNIKGNSFTDLKNTLGVIYVVRDPRNIITSIVHHFSKENYYEAKEFMFEEKNIIGRNLEITKEKYRETEIITLISSWKTNYNSWKNFPKNLLLVKYEDLINNAELEFSKISYFISKLLKIKIDEKKIKASIYNNSFEKLKIVEETEGFGEAITNNNDKVKKFFNLGPSNNYKKILENEIRKEIELKFNSEMKELGYI